MKTNIKNIISLSATLLATFVFIGCGKKSNNTNNPYSSFNRRNLQYQVNPGCLNCPGGTNLFAEAIGHTGQGMTEVEFGFGLYTEMAQNSTQVQFHQNSVILAEGYMRVLKDTVSYCPLVPDVYQVNTVNPGQFDLNGNFVNLVVEAIGMDTRARVILRFQNLGVSPLNPYVISQVDQMQYNNNINGSFFIESNQGPYHPNCTPVGVSIQVGGM